MDEWATDSHGAERPGYRISRRGPGVTGWRLEMAPSLVRRGASQVSHHPTLRLAIDRAENEEAARLRRAVAATHFVIAALTGVAFAMLAPHMGSLLGLGATAAAFYLAIRSFGNGLAAGLSEAWGWTRNDRPRPFPLERAVMSVVRRVRRRMLRGAERRSTPIVVEASAD